MNPSTCRHPRAFTLVEALVTIAILSIMAGVLISAFSSATTDASRMIARQQQAAVQNAVNAWVNGDTNRVNVINATTGAGKLRTVEEIRTDYNSRTTSLARLNLVSGYLDDPTKNHFFSSTTNSDKIKSEALTATKQFLTLPTWASGSYPQVQLNAE
ncbi:type II secretion system protein [Verrucomicrobium spinosum]|uniref:type II secretion system protein n=1 Tax=Verrucomicrobium spinosum TaxID=2736 RepID=UPI0001746A6F|nr:type II secretion system protein [Verrucomicrobium spinosum]